MLSLPTFWLRTCSLSIPDLLHRITSEVCLQAWNSTANCKMDKYLCTSSWVLQLGIWTKLLQYIFIEYWVGFHLKQDRISYAMILPQNWDPVNLVMDVELRWFVLHLTCCHLWHDNHRRTRIANYWSSRTGQRGIKRPSPSRQKFSSTLLVWHDLCWSLSLRITRSSSKVRADSSKSWWEQCIQIQNNWCC